MDEKSKAIYVQVESGITSPSMAFTKDGTNDQNEFRQRLNGSTTAFQILRGVNLSGKYALITGSNAGIGYETAKSLAQHGCNVLLACRNMEATQEAIERIVKETHASEDNLKAIHLDLASFQSVKKCALKVKSLFSDCLDMVILNAGIFGVPYSETEDNIELILQINHLSHMVPYLKNMFTERNLALSKDYYCSIMAYNNSKLFNIITTKVLAEEWKNKGVTVNSVHPGHLIYTKICKSWWLYRLAFFIVRPLTKSLQQAAATTIYAATAPELEGASGMYFNNCFGCEESTLARDRDIAREVFAISLHMIREKVGDEHLQKYLIKYPIYLFISDVQQRIHYTLIIIKY